MRICHLLLAALSFVAAQTMVAVPTSLGQIQQRSNPVHTNFGKNERIKLIVGTSRVIKFDFDVPGVVIGSPEVVDAQPISSNQIMITGRRPGVSGLSVSDSQNNQHTIDILVVGDSRQLQLTLNELFPNSTIKAVPLNTNVVLTGHVARTDQIRQAEAVAQDFFPQGVRNLLTIGGPKKIALECKVIEVSRTKLRDMGIDWSVATSAFTLQNSAAALATAGATSGAGNFFFQIVDGTSQFPLFLNLLRQNNLAKILTQPTLVTAPGRPASLLNGGMVPIPVNTGLGVQGVEFREFGTKLDVLPILEGDGRIRVEVRAEVTDVAQDLAVNGTPGFRSRNVDTGVPLKEGQTLALAGLLQSRTDSVIRGVPGLRDMPWVGAMFRRVEDTYNEVELIILITPRFIHEVDPSMVPDGPGRGTVPPCDTDFFIRGYQEVPRTDNSYQLYIRPNAIDNNLFNGTPQAEPIGQGTGSGQGIGNGQEGGSGQAAPQTGAGTTSRIYRSNSAQQVNGFKALPVNPTTFRTQPLPQQPVVEQPAARSASRPIRSPYAGPMPKFHLSDRK